MAIQSPVIAKRIENGGKPFDLFPLTLEQISTLLADHGQSLREVIARFAPHYGSKDPIIGTQLSLALLGCAPGLIAATIATSAGDVADAHVAATLPAATQLMAFLAIVELSLAGFTPAQISTQLLGALAPLNSALARIKH